MGKSLKNPPVYLTLVQTIFNPISALASDYLAKIQEGFRIADFPDFKKHQRIGLQVTMQGGQSVPTPITVDRYTFGNYDRTHLFILDEQGLSLQSTRYGDFESFSGAYLKGLKIVHDVVGLAYYERIGLRYLDRVMPYESESVEQYLVDHAHGMSTCLGGKSVHSFVESFNDFGRVKLLSRVVLQEGSLSPPPDVQLDSMHIDSRFLGFNGRHAMLDNDGFIEGREIFSFENIQKNLSDIHEITSAAFKATVSPSAIKTWDK